MDRRTLIASGLMTLGAARLAHAEPILLPPARKRDAAAPAAQPAQTEVAQAQPAPQAPPPPNSTPSYPTAGPTDTSGRPDQPQTYSEDEIVHSVSDFMGVTAESAGGAVERVFKNNGRPTAYIAGEEGSGAIGVGARYGRGLLYMKGRQPMEVFWQGPSVGWDFGGNASRVFTLCYMLDDPRDIFQRFPGVEGSAYFIGGLGVNYQRANDIILAPIRAGVGFRLGANIGYLAYSRRRSIIPF
ncbi:MAG TPA: DUF1134 domain-containing protein [Phenylobacterium sp.]|jgi:hypothetical protein|uniref:DUF1134 domain-containing protein n=1 Tax=Phenylobacterium sp. TaxID=1871053 RepID=UPI002C2C8E2A|nr:DUF1134 domain-containing protein [Phenylobacterium sp.]HXA40781.1 DUF1134 domain-containing protein [Phenylobacterium sp.]